MEWLRSRSSIMHVINDVDQFEGFAMAAMPDVGAPDERPIVRPKSVEEGMRDPGRKAALMREFMAHVKQTTFEIVDRTWFYLEC